MAQLFQWLVEHEKVVASITFILAVTLLVQVKFFGVASDGPVSTNPTEINSVATDPIVAGPLSGVWEMRVRKPKGGVQNWTLSLTQNGEALSGVLTSEGGDLPVTGTIKGNEINLAAEKFGTTVELPATFDGQTMTGTMKVLMISREWTAKRK